MTRQAKIKQTSEAPSRDLTFDEHPLEPVIGILRSPFAGIVDQLILYTSVRWIDPQTGWSGRHEMKARVLRALWRPATRLTSFWTDVTSGGLADVEVRADRLGRPIAFVGTTPGPPISFTHSSGRTWGALNLGTSHIGIDTATPDDFAERYPFDRAFHPWEFSSALQHTDDYGESAAALLWSIKESAVKALGCGFRLLSSLDLSVTLERATGDRLTFSVFLSKAALARLPEETTVPVVGLSFREHGVRVSLAAVNPGSRATLW